MPERLGLCAASYGFRLKPRAGTSWAFRRTRSREGEKENGPVERPHLVDRPEDRPHAVSKPLLSAIDNECQVVAMVGSGSVKLTHYPMVGFPNIAPASASRCTSGNRLTSRSLLTR